MDSKILSSQLQKRVRHHDSDKGHKNKTIGGFLIEDVSEDEDSLQMEEPPFKRHIRCLSIDDDKLRPDKSMDPSTETETITRILDQLVSKRAEELKSPDDSINENSSIVPGTALNTSNEPVPEYGKNKTAVLEISTSSGSKIPVKMRQQTTQLSMPPQIAAWSATKSMKARKTYYGIPLYELIEEAKEETQKDNSENTPKIQFSTVENTIFNGNSPSSLMWTEKYRAKNFMELIGDNSTHRQVLRWLKAWDSIVFPASRKCKQVRVPSRKNIEDEKKYRKILLLAGPPGLGKTTLAHVCARQAGYETVEINASDDRSKSVVKNQIKTTLGTESVKNGSQVKSKSGHVENYAHPLCVIVDEVDGVDSGSSGDGGFVKALMELILTDQKNTYALKMRATNPSQVRKKIDKFRFLRPLILICNDVYHPTLRPIRNSDFVEVIHVRKPRLDDVITRMKSIFEKEAIECEEDAIRRLCEVTWEINTSESRKGKEGACEGDFRSLLIVGEWAARKLKIVSKNQGRMRLTRQWVDQNISSDIPQGRSEGLRSGRGSIRDIVNRVFLEGAGFPHVASSNSVGLPNEKHQTQLGVAELKKRAGINRLRDMVESNDTNRIILDIFSQYPNQTFNDDSMLSKPDAAYEWFHFYDTCSSQVYSDQRFELVQYLCQPILACHYLFASPARHFNSNIDSHKKRSQVEEADNKICLSFTGPQADYNAYETEKSNRATISSFLTGFDATYLRSFRNPENFVTTILPYLIRILSPDIKPIIFGGGGGLKSVGSVKRDHEKIMIQRTVNIMSTIGVVFEEDKFESDLARNTNNFIYRMKPPLDDLVFFETANTSIKTPPPTRYIVRHILNQEYQKHMAFRENSKSARSNKIGKRESHTSDTSLEKQKKPELLTDVAALPIKKDFFGRVIAHSTSSRQNEMPAKNYQGDRCEREKVWVTFHEGFSNAVRKPLTIENLLRGL